MALTTDHPPPQTERRQAPARPAPALAPATPALASAPAALAVAAGAESSIPRPAHSTAPASTAAADAATPACPAAAKALLTAARASGESLSCLVLDIDHFKKVNDSHGHGIGDRVIQETARKLEESARAGDLVCRYGGEEFVMVLPGLDAAAALRVAERVRATVEAECGATVREVPGLRVTISLGVATLGTRTALATQLVDAADQALYQAKRGGRNRAVLAEQKAAVAAPAAAPVA